MALGPQFHDAFGPEPVRSNARRLINQRAASDRPVLNPEETRQVFNAVNIRNWPLALVTTDQRWASGGAGETSGTRDFDEVLHTSQGHLYAPAVQKYMSGDVPEFDPDYADEEGVSDVRYLPEIQSTERGTPWIGEGHHRLVASRLLGQDSDTWEYGLTKPKY